MEDYESGIPLEGDKRCKAVVRININTGEITHYKSATQAARQNHVPTTAIYNYLYGRTHGDSNYIWKFEDESEEQKVAKAKEKKQNSIVWEAGSKEILVNLYDRKLSNKITKLAAELGAEVEQKEDGGISCRLPLECLKIGKKRHVTMSDEQKAELAARLMASRKKD